MPKKLFLTDLDGAVRLPAAGKPAIEPPRPLGKILHLMRQCGYTIAAATGTSYRSARETESHLSIRLDGFSHSYGIRMLMRRRKEGQTEFSLVPPEERWAVQRLNPRLDDISRRHNGLRDDYGPCHTAFFPTPEEFELARQEVAELVNGQHGIRFMANPSDRGITVAPASATKQQVVEWFQENGFEITVAAGDTSSDIPLLENAVYPIVTCTDEHTPPHPELVAIVQRKGRGHIATRPHGYGLIDGLNQARADDILSF